MIEINNQTTEQIDDAWIIKIASAVLLGEHSQKDLSIGIIAPERIQKLNKQYRKKDDIPDELSFANPDFGIGELLLCPQQISKNATEYGITEQVAFARSIIHGVLHLLGYHHEQGKNQETIMKEKENTYLQAIGLTHL